MKRIVMYCFTIATILFFAIPTKALALTADDNDAIADHPAGLKVNDYFIVNKQMTVADQSEVGFSYNSAKISGTNDDVLVLTNETNTENKNWNTSSYGAIWSNPASGVDNYFDINEEQTISAWLYFGPDFEAKSEYNEQGMALVLQNDSRKDKAIGMGSQGLGVYAFDKAYTASVLGFSTRTYASNDFMKNTVIQNSMALEFDTQRNDVTKNGSEPITFYNSITVGSGNATFSLNGYDSIPSVKPQVPSIFPSKTQLGAAGAFGHIALTYPGDIKTYVSVPTDADRWQGYSQAYSMYHIDPTPTQLVNDTDLEGNELLWHHITFKWIPHENDDKATIEYHYNDKNIDGTENFNKSGNNFIRVDKSIEVDPKQFGDVKDGKLYWGFTGANGQTAGVNSKMVVFESIPAMATGLADVTIVNDITGMIVKEGDYIPHGTPVTITYKAEFDEGRQNWKDILSKQNLPRSINYLNDGGLLAMTNYDDGTSVPFYTSNTTGPYPEFVSLPIRDLGPYNGNSKNSAEIVIHGTTENNTTENIDVSSQPATYTGSNAIATTSSPNFTIGTKKIWTLNLSGGMDQKLVYTPEQNPALNLPTKLNYSDDHSLDGDEFTFKIEFENGKTYTTTAEVNDSGEVELDLAAILKDEFWDVFVEGSTQKITVTATDIDNITSNSTEYNIKVIPDKLLKLDVDDSLSFKTINMFDQSEIINRATAYDVNVTSYNNPWRLNAAATDMKTTSGETFEGDLVYVTEDKKSALTNGLIPIALDDESHTEKKNTSITDSWSKQTGVLLQQAGLNSAGHYEGTLTWQLVDYIE